MFGHKINVPKIIFGYLTAIVFLQLTLCNIKEFSKIGHKVFIPPGVKNMVATSCHLNAPRCATTVPQVRLHGSRGGVFVGHRPPRDPGDPLQK